MEKIRAVVVDPQAPGRLALQEVAAPVPLSNEALVRVHAFSLNRGEVRRGLAAAAGWRPGWDIAGTVEAAAADGSGPARAARVVGLLPAGAWAEVVAVPTSNLAEIPPGVSFAQASTLPVAGLTALYTLEKGGGLIDRQVLITGASGGVGYFAIQLARLAGAQVVGLVHQETHAGVAREAGANLVVAGDPAGAAAHGPYHLVLDSVGGQTLAAALGMLARRGVCVNFGITEADTTTFNVQRFYMTGGASLVGFFLFDELPANPAGPGLARLASLVATGRLRPRIELEDSWTAVGKVAQELYARRYSGKAVLLVQT